MKRLVVLISGQGSNMQAIVRQCALQGWPAQVVGVLSNRPDAQGLAFAQEQGIATAVVDHRAYESREAFDDALSEAIDALRPDGVILAGFMRILGERFVQRYAQRLLNIHPSLLPAFPGLDTHQRALDAGCKVAGATVHFVTAELDHGPIVMQSVVAVRADDDAHTLAQRAGPYHRAPSRDFETGLPSRWGGLCFFPSPSRPGSSGAAHLGRDGLCRVAPALVVGPLGSKWIGGIGAPLGHPRLAGQ
ncbi:MAG: phosphoribosylglycinamide formyltransferase [Betaproteobacteria bacterium]|nr:phosphoribosylglycinamide formyltransferase [Betaproteobacteria bacterium]